MISAAGITATDTSGNPTTLGQTSQGEGSHLGSITLDTAADFQEVTLDDSAGRADYFEDSEAQTLSNATTIDGTTYGAGTNVESEYRITLQDSDGNNYFAWAVEVEDGDGTGYENVVGLTFEGGNVPPRGEELTVVDNTDLFALPGNNTQELQYSDGVPCFTAGTLIETPSGPRPIETLQTGDRVMTRDNGPRTLRGVARRRLSGAALRDAPHLRPIRFEPDSLAPGIPARRTWLSPQHRVLIATPRSELYFGLPETFAKAKHLAGRAGIRRDDRADSVTYFHLFLEDHEVLLADGMWSESFFPGSTIRRDGDADLVAEMAELFPDALEPDGSMTLVRPELRGWETALLPDCTCS
ncbi:Hint domain-containing protein [Roseovarius salinarum]|uniref:Hint domain-containing protein n=1 Tax=Roseovarius salinarum TaxID=1981892 RepID=UPI001E3CF8A9|nr:Hint domain-containing protein [Roseovarius salinarum]